MLAVEVVLAVGLVLAVEVVLAVGLVLAVDQPPSSLMGPYQVRFDC